MLGGIVQIAGSLALFLYGMKVMSEGMQKAAGDRLQRILSLMTVNRFAAVLTGLLVTALVQSSSASTVMVVGFVNAGLLSLGQAIGVIMGANIGTTVTGWIVALFGFKFRITAVALPAVAVGLPLLLSRRLGREEWGEVLIGFGLLFLGLEFLKEAVPDVRSHPEHLEFVTRYTGRGLLSYLFFVALGSVVTVIVQSSSASMAVTLTLANAGWIDLPTAAAIVLGENIGTTVTANLAAIGASANARRAARAHLLFNVLGVLWMTVVFVPFLKLVDLIEPGSGRDPAWIPAHLALFHTLFNVANTLLFVGLVPQISRLVERLVPERQGKDGGRYQFRYFTRGIQDTPEINLLSAQAEVRRMGELVEEMFAACRRVFRDSKARTKREVRKIQESEELSDQMQEEISAYLVACAQEHLSPEGAAHLNAMMRVVHEQESIGDSCLNLMLLCDRQRAKGIEFRARALEELERYIDLVREFLRFDLQLLQAGDGRDALDQAYKLEKRINKYRNTLRDEARRRLTRSGGVKEELLYIDVVHHLEQIGDHCLNICQALLEPTSPRDALQREGAQTGGAR